jgi:hypothetical protein
MLREQETSPTLGAAREAGDSEMPPGTLSVDGGTSCSPPALLLWDFTVQFPAHTSLLRALSSIYFVLVPDLVFYLSIPIFLSPPS